MRWFQRVALAAIFTTVVVSAHADITGGSGPGPAGGVGTPVAVTGNITQWGSGNVPTLGAGIVGTAVTPTSASGAAIPGVVSVTNQGNIVLKSSFGNLYDLYVTTGATAGWLMVFNATSAPADGAVTPAQCIVAPANTTTSLFTAGAPPESYTTGIVAVFSTTGCFTKTASATVFFHGRTD